jgi:non-specific serine/threonine protein kinase/serine/threonine-protein kinase
LSGHCPFQSQENDFKLIYQAVIEVEPPPSALVETTAKSTGDSIDRAKSSETPTQILTSDNNTGLHKNRQTRLQTIRLSSNSLRGDLDNIVLKALRKEPERRYSSAENLSQDIRRHLAGLPLTARPNTFSYRAEKFIKRHSLGVFAAALILLAILGVITATLWQARIAQNERFRAEQRFKDVRKLANSYLFDVYPQIENLEGSLKARQTILTNALTYLDSLANEAGNDVELQRELATAYEKVGDVQGALNTTSAGDVASRLSSYKKAQILRESASAANPKNADFKNELAQNYYITRPEPPTLIKLLPSSAVSPKPTR